MLFYGALSMPFLITGVLSPSQTSKIFTHQTGSENKDVLGVAKKLLRVVILGMHWQVDAPLIKRLEAREPSLSIVIAAEVGVQTQKLGNVRGRLAKKSEVASVVWILFQRL